MHHDQSAPGPGHNAPRPRQWQTPHRAHDHAHPERPAEPDLDLVESAFVEGFGRASDPTSFLRLARVPFVTEHQGERLDLIRVEIRDTTDVASVTPVLGGAGHRVAPLPQALVSRRQTLAFVYMSGHGSRHLDLATVRSLPDLTPDRD